MNMRVGIWIMNAVEGSGIGEDEDLPQDGKPTCRENVEVFLGHVRHMFSHRPPPESPELAQNKKDLRALLVKAPTLHDVNTAQFPGWWSTPQYKRQRNIEKKRPAKDNDYEEEENETDDDDLKEKRKRPRLARKAKDSGRGSDMERLGEILLDLVASADDEDLAERHKQALMLFNKVSSL